MFATTVGSAAGSHRELSGQGRRLALLCAQAVVGGMVGAALLLGLPSEAFEVVVPWLVASGALLLLARDRIRSWVAAVSNSRSLSRRGSRAGRTGWGAAVMSTGCYGGYFGAGAGIIMLAVISLRADEPLAVTNAVKNVVTGCANLVATLAFVAFAPIDYTAAGALSVGALVGSWVGPAVVRVLPERPLRYAIGWAGLALAVFLV
jgi:uncharacterized protein